jgi:hypothetical protein
MTPQELQKVLDELEASRSSRRRAFRLTVFMAANRAEDQQLTEPNHVFVTHPET